MLRTSKNQATWIRCIIWILFDDLAGVKRIQNLIRDDASQGFCVHLSPGMIGKATARDTSADGVVVHSASDGLHLVAKEPIVRDIGIIVDWSLRSICEAASGVCALACMRMRIE